MEERDEALPRQRRHRRTIFPKRVELRVTEEQDAMVSSAAVEASAATGRSVSYSEVIRSAIENGCRALGREVQSAQPTSDGVTREQIAALGEAVELAGGQIRRVGVNVDQLAAKANATGVVVESIAETKEELRLIRAEMVAAFGQVLGYTGDED